MTIQEAAARLRARKTSSVDLTTEAFRRIESLNPGLNAIQTPMMELALKDASLADLDLAERR